MLAKWGSGDDFGLQGQSLQTLHIRDVTASSSIGDSDLWGTDSEKPRATQIIGRQQPGQAQQNIAFSFTQMKTRKEDSRN